MRDSPCPKRDKSRVAFVCSQSSQARFVCLYLNLFIPGVASWAVIWTTSGYPFYFRVSGTLKSCFIPLCHFCTCGWWRVSLLFSHRFSFCSSWAARGITEGREKRKSLFSVPAFTCLLRLRVKHISTAAAQHKGAKEVEILTAVNCS